MLKVPAFLSQRLSQRKNFADIDHKKATIPLGKYIESIPSDSPFPLQSVP